MHNKKIFILVAFALFIISGVIGYYGPDWFKARQEETLRANFVPLAISEEIVKNFSLQFNELSQATEPKFLPDTPFLTQSGGRTRISDFAGKPTLVNLWATWCAPCVVELPHLQKLAEYYDGRLNVIAISIENNKTPADITDFLDKRQISAFAGYVDTQGDIMKNLGIRGIPTSFLIGSNGLILYRFEGDADWTSAQSKAFFDAFLLQNR